MSYEIITKFSFNKKKNTYTITAHPNNVFPADNWTTTLYMNYENMMSLFDNLMDGYLQPTNGVVVLNYAIARATYETEQHFNIEHLRSYLWDNRQYIDHKRVYTDIEKFAFGLFLKYLYEKDSPDMYIVTDGSYIYRNAKSRYSYSYIYVWDDIKFNYKKFHMTFKKAYTFIANYTSIKNLRPELVAA